VNGPCVLIHFYQKRSGLLSSAVFVFSPLGPFVPAPPEIAMHMMREQGGAPPFEPNGAPHGNTGVHGPMLGGLAPIITMPPNFRHDPRRLRRLELFTKFHDCILFYLLVPNSFSLFWNF
jgi:hypothetical protein